MRRSICRCEPHVAMAGQVGTWKFTYITAAPLPKKTRLRFDLQTQGRDIDWEVPSCSPSATSNVIYAQLEDGTLLQAKAIESPESITPFFEFSLPSPLKIGESITIVVGQPLKSKAAPSKSGNMAQKTTQRRRSFLLSIDPKGTGNFQEAEVFSMDVRGNALDHIQILCPSFVTKNKRFDVMVRFEDAYGNLTSHAPEGTLIELTHDQFRENLNWKLFVPETGFVVLPNLYFNEAGTYKICLRNLQTKECFYSAPLRCLESGDRKMFWGVLHGESDRVDSTDNIEACLRHFRDDRAFNFYGTSCFESLEETSNEIWKLVLQYTAEFNEDHRFSTLLGWQWEGEGGQEGLRHVVYGKDGKPIFRKKDAKYSSLEKLYKHFPPKEYISIPCYTMGKNQGFDFRSFDPDIERVVEIYNAWGCSEMSAKEGNPFPILSNTSKGSAEYLPGSIRTALNRNCRFGFCAGGLDDRGSYADFFESDQEQYSPGMTAIIAPELSRENLLDALYRRSCYATTGEKIIVDFSISGQPIGSECNTEDRPGLAINRHLVGFVAGTSKIKEVQIIRNGEIFHTLHPDSHEIEFTLDDMDPLDTLTLDGGPGRPPFIYYYLRILQEDGHMAWISPIWIDHTSTKALSIGSKKAVKKGISPQEERRSAKPPAHPSLRKEVKPLVTTTEKLPAKKESAAPTTTKAPSKKAQAIAEKKPAKGASTAKATPVKKGSKKS